MLVKQIFNMTLVGADWILWILIALSLISVSVMVERAIMLFLNKIRIEEVKRILSDYLFRGEVKQASDYLKNIRSPEARICFAGLEKIESGVATVEEIIVGKTNDEKLKMEKNLYFLGSIGSNAPFIGLFGTVLGIIKAFHDLSLGTKQGAEAVMSGISEALVATAVGLLVAIPAVLAFNFFKQKVKERLVEADSLSRIIFAYLKRIK